MVNTHVYVKCENTQRKSKIRVQCIEISMTNRGDMSEMLDIQAWVDFICVSNVRKSICDNSDSNMVNTHVYTVTVSHVYCYMTKHTVTHVRHGTVKL